VGAIRWGYGNPSGSVETLFDPSGVEDAFGKLYRGYRAGTPSTPGYHLEPLRGKNAIAPRISIELDKR